VVRASIEIRAPIAEALHRWSEFSTLEHARLAHGCLSQQVDFRPLPGARARVTVRLDRRGACPEAATARRALEDQLVAFEGFVDDSGLRPCGNARC
jgi:hypothetical protein